MRGRRERAPLLLVVGGVVLAVAGVVVLVVATVQATSEPASFGWFAYAPLSDTTFVADGLHLVSTTSLVGAGLLVVGLLALSAWFGYRLGTRGRDLETSD